MKIFRITLIFALVLATILGCEERTISVLLLSGRNNHNWQETTPVIKNLLEESGRFIVTVNNEPENLPPGGLNHFDVILSNWNTWPDVNGQRWNADLEQAFLAYVAEGKGFVVIHAGSSALQDWPEFQQIAGGTWELNVTGHGPVHTFKARIEEKDHPIMKGLEDFYIKDELWHKTGFHPEVQVLCSAFSSTEKKGTGTNEPVVITTQYGKGRGFYCVLGHNKATMQNTAWRTIILRGTEWAATGKVTIPAREPWPVSIEIAEKQSTE